MKPWRDIKKDFLGVSVRDALKKCHAHPLDDAVMLTTEEEGLWAIHDPHVRLVRLERAVPGAVREFFEAIGPDEIGTLGGRMLKARQVKKGESFLFHGVRLPQALVEDMRDQATLFFRLFNKKARKSSLHLISGEGIDQIGLDSKRIHVDDGPTLHTAYAGCGVEFALGQVACQEFYDSLKYKTSATAGVPLEMAGPGDIIVFKGEKDQQDTPPGFVRGQLHCTPSPEKQKTMGSPRIAFAVY